MKCVILAGGTGDLLWPLSRKNYPKQFMKFEGDRSLFQETVTRNMPFCDEFLILSNAAYQTVIEGQLQSFQSVAYRIFPEKEARGTAAALNVLFSVLSDEDTILVTSADLTVRGENYSDAVYAARRRAKEGRIVLFGVTPTEPRTTVGYLKHENGSVTEYREKPDSELAGRLWMEPDTLWNAGIFLTTVGTLRREYERHGLWGEMHRSGAEKSTAGSACRTEEECGTAEELCRTEAECSPGSLETLLFEKSSCLSVTALSAAWDDISDFAAWKKWRGAENGKRTILAACENTDIINDDPARLVVASGMENAYIVNTQDAVYVVDKNHTDDIRALIRDNRKAYPEHMDENPKLYRDWGTRELLNQGHGFRVRRIVIYPGRSISLHTHERRTENYAVVEGVLSVQLDGRFLELGAGESVGILPSHSHRLYNASDRDVVLIEVDTGEEIVEQDIKRQEPKEEPPCVPEILRLSPAYKDYLWGGSRLKELFHKDTPYEITAESWELSAHPDGQSIIADGPLAGTKFGAFVHKYGSAVCGWKSETFDRFPVLVKFIDTKQPLSIQIHPDDDYAFVNEGEFGKNECWYVCEAAPDAYLYCGFKRDVTGEELTEHIRQHTVTELLNRVPVKQGDVIFVPAGTIHAIGAGILICEIQQSSNSTYRIFDYDRLDSSGKPRQLHVKQALEVVDKCAFAVTTEGLYPPVKHDGYTGQVIVQCKYFRCTRYTVEEAVVIAMDDASFQSVIVLSGSGTLTCRGEVRELSPGESYFVPAGRKLLHIRGKCELIVTNI